MLLSIGRRTRSSELTDLLRDCHDRIRHFAVLAVRLATEPASDDERAAVAASIARYFGEALPLHMRHEEESLLPRLEGQDPELDAALTRMRAEHDDHDVQRAELVERTRAIAREPRAYETHVERLRELAPQLRDDLLTHVEAEERVILPAVPRLLSTDQRDAVMAEMRARRVSAFA